MLRILVFALVLSGCAGKKVEEPQTSPVLPGDQQISPAVKEEPPTKKQKLALVLGGAGIASFATVGLLKEFDAKGIHFDFIVATGWPALFVLAHQFSGSVHDAEWFAVRIQKNDLLGGGLIDFSKGYADHSGLLKYLNNKFSQRDLRQTKVPVYLSRFCLERTESLVSDEGKWEASLLGAFSVVGIHRPYSIEGERWVSSLHGLDVSAASKLGADRIIAVDMYQDYLATVVQNTRQNLEGVLLEMHSVALRRNIAQALASATHRGAILLKNSPTDFNAKRQAILAGTLEAARLAREIQSQ